MEERKNLFTYKQRPPQFDREEVPLRYEPDERVAADSRYAVAPTTVLRSRQQQQPPAFLPTGMTNGKRRAGGVLSS